MATTNDNVTKTNEELERENAQMRLELANAQATINNLHDAMDGLHAEGRFSFTNYFKEEAVNDLYLKLRDEIRLDLNAWVSGPELSNAERRRLQGASHRRYGFIDEISDVMQTNARFIPSNVDEGTFKLDIRLFEVVRNINIMLTQMQRTVQDIQLVMADDLYRQALSYYGSVRDAAIRRVEGAQALFELLRSFFHRRRQQGDEPTEHEVERDVRALLHGRKDGKVLIENEHPHVEGGKHTVIDETHKPNNN